MMQVADRSARHVRNTWVLPILIGFVAFAAFAILESKLKNPVFPIRLLAHPAFLGTVIMGIFWNLANGSITQMLANIWQYVFDWNTVQVSLGQAF